MIVGIPKETFPGERRVALIPSAVPALKKAGLEVWLESGAGVGAGWKDAEYQAKGARVASDREALFGEAQVIVQVRGPGANPEAGSADVARLRSGHIYFGMLDPLAATDSLQKMAGTGATVFAMELIPRTTKAQSMDVLSSMATVAGYLAVLEAAIRLPKFFPMFMTAAGTIKPAKVFVLGAGVAGLQAISTARRLGAVVAAYDTRPAVKEQVQSLGGKFVEFQLETGDAQDAGGYAKGQSEEFYRRQQEQMAGVIKEHDVVITTAAVPGRQSPLLVTRAMVEGMPPGSVIVDLAAEKGGNCEVTQAGRDVDHHGVTVVGPINLAARLPVHASQMYSKNLETLLVYLAQDGCLKVNRQDEITNGALAACDGQVVHPSVLKAMGGA